MKRPRDFKYLFELEIKVRDYEVDSEGIVNNAVYLHYLEHTRHEFCEWAGLTFRDMHSRGIDPVLSHIEMDYRRPLGLGDRMVSKLAVERRGPLFVFHQDIFTPEGDVVVMADVSIATLVDGRLSRGDELMDAFGPFCNPQ